MHSCRIRDIEPQTPKTAGRVTEQMKRVITTLLLAALMVGACGRIEDEVTPDFSDRTINIVATTGMVGDIVENVGGERVEVTTLMGPGIDPHLYKASEGDVDRIDRADMVFYNGLHLEAKLAEVFEKMGKHIVTIPVAEQIPEEELIVVGTGVGAHDPHVWFDVDLWSIATEEVRKALVTADPANADGYNDRAEAFQRELETLDAYVIDEAATIPEEQRVLITAHDAFGYFAKAYGFEVLGLQGVSTATEAGAGDVQDLADFIVEREIPAIFVETSVSPERSPPCRKPSAPRATMSWSGESSSRMRWVTPTPRKARTSEWSATISIPSRALYLGKLQRKNHEPDSGNRGSRPDCCL